MSENGVTPDSGASSEPNETKAMDFVQEQLVSYLDGELSPGEVEKVERRLATDPEFHDRLIQLQRTWDMLDCLPKTEPSESFTRTTVELVTRSLEKEVKHKQLSLFRRKITLVSSLIIVSVLAGGVGFAVVRWNQEADNRQLVEDLPVIENVDLYRNADSIVFLERLSEEGLFEDE